MKTIVEAGHFYEINGPSALSIAGWNIGKEYASNVPYTELALFVDDFHETQTFLEPGDSFFAPEFAKQLAADMLDEADHVFSEAAIAAESSNTAQSLLEDGLVKLKKGVMSVQGIRLGCLRR